MIVSSNFVNGLSKFQGQSCYRPRRTGERRRKSVRGCIVDANLSVLNLIIVKRGKTKLKMYCNIFTNS